VLADLGIAKRRAGRFTGQGGTSYLLAHSCFLEEVASKLPTNQPPIGQIPTRANRYPDPGLHRRPAHQIWARIGGPARSHVSDSEPLPRSRGRSPSGRWVHPILTLQFLKAREPNPPSCGQRLLLSSASVSQLKPPPFTSSTSTPPVGPRIKKSPSRSES
jgi:hypothetical protein